MADVVAYLRDFNMVTAVLRLLLAVLFGGLIGMERERKRRPAGFRTYMLVCLGAALTMLLSLYNYQMMATQWQALAESIGAHTDVSRLGAQVINGIGFLGAGTIIVTGRQEVKGITTAAGLWASACMGLAIGAGFYECVLIGFVLIILSITVFPQIENSVTTRSRYMNLYVEFSQMEVVGHIIAALKASGCQVFDVEMYEEWETEMPYPNVLFTILLPPKQTHEFIIAEVSATEGIRTVEEV